MLGALLVGLAYSIGVAAQEPAAPQQRRPDSALASWRRELAIAREQRDSVHEAVALNNLGAIFGHLSRPDSALAYFHQALAIERALGDRAREVATFGNMAAVADELARPDLALAYYDSAAQALTEARRGAESDVNRVAFTEQWSRLFERWALFWLSRTEDVGEQSAALAALDVVERGRAQALLELMRGPGAIRWLPALAGPIGMVVRPGVGVLYYFVTKDTLVVWVGSPRGEVTVTRIEIGRDSLAALVSGWRATLGVDAATARGRLLADRESPPLEDEARGLNNPGSAGAAAGTAAALGRLLLPRGLASWAPAVRELVIVPHGVLTLVPFAALPLDSIGTLLGDQFALRYAPSLASLAEAEHRDRRSLSRSRLREALVVGNPVMPVVSTVTGRRITLAPLPGAAAEGRWLAGYVGAPFLTGSRATEVTILRRLPAAPLVHLATHGYAYTSDAKARESFVALAPGGGEDGLLTVGEILDNPSFTLSAELVVLSACQTGLGDVKRAEGTVGLQRAFLARGARSVLVSLWSVSDAATSSLMHAFYAHWLGDGDRPTKAEALRRAEEAVRADPRFAAPRYWAAFQLVGAQ